MALSSDSAKAIAQLGANIIITAEAKYSSDTLKTIVQLVKAKGNHVTIHAGALSSDTLKAIAMIGGSHVTIAL